jgi:hypothetical protein
MGGNFIFVYNTATASISLLAVLTCSSYDQVIYTIIHFMLINLSYRILVTSYVSQPS